MPRDLALGQDAGESETADPSQLRRLAEREQPASVERSSEFLPYALFRLGFGDPKAACNRVRDLEGDVHPDSYGACAAEAGPTAQRPPAVLAAAARRVGRTDPIIANTNLGRSWRVSRC